MHDLMNHINVRPVMPPKAAVTNANTAQVGTIVDTLGYDSLVFVILTGVNTDANATFATLLEDGDTPTLTDNATVIAGETLGTAALASFTFNDDNKCFKIGYAGHRRYVRLTVTPAGNDAGDMFLSAIAILGHPSVAPTPNPPV